MWAQDKGILSPLPPHLTATQGTALTHGQLVLSHLSAQSPSAFAQLGSPKRMIKPVVAGMKTLPREVYINLRNALKQRWEILPDREKLLLLLPSVCQLFPP